RANPTYYSKEQRDYCLQFAAVLRGIPNGLDATDLQQIYTTLNARAMNLPRFDRTYNNKRWFYLFFSSEETREAAMDQTVNFRGRKLFWHSTDDVKKFCPRFSALNHAAKDCDAFGPNSSDSRSK